MPDAVVVTETSTVESVARDLCALNHPGLMGLCPESISLAARYIVARDLTIWVASHGPLSAHPYEGTL